MHEHEYATYLDACNRRDWTLVRSYLSDGLRVNGEPSSAQHYLDGLKGISARYPDHHWSIIDVRRAHDFITACLTTERAGERGLELAQYRTRGAMIMDVWTRRSLDD